VRWGAFDGGALALMLSSERTGVAESSSFATSMTRIRLVHFGQTVMSTAKMRLSSQDHGCLEGSGGGARYLASFGMKSGSWTPFLIGF
jgi:hypothetical protein